VANIPCVFARRREDHGDRTIDPMGTPTPAKQVEKGKNQAKGARVKGAARGAAKGWAEHGVLFPGLRNP